MLENYTKSQTREVLLWAAFREMQKSGFESASLTKILADTGLTKGALYHYFPNKVSLGYAVVDEIVLAQIRQRWLDPLANTDDPISLLLDIIVSRTDYDQQNEVFLGCPLSNLAQEMSAKDDGFRRRLSDIYQAWQRGIEQAIVSGQQRQHIRTDVDAREVGVFIVAAIQGCAGMVRSTQDKDIFPYCAEGISTYLRSLVASNR